MASFQNEYVQWLGSNQDTPTARQQFIAKKTLDVANDRKAMVDQAYQQWVATNGPLDTPDKTAAYTTSISNLQQKFDVMDSALQTLQQTWVPSGGPPPPPAAPANLTVPLAPPPGPNAHGRAPVPVPAPTPSYTPALASAAGATST